MEGIGRFALLEDAEDSGYSPPEDAVSVKRVRQDFLGHCEGVAAELLHSNVSPALAKASLRKALEDIGQETSTQEFTVDEQSLVVRYANEIDQKIDQLALMSDRQRDIHRLYHRTPEFVRNWILIIILVVVTVTIVLAVSS